jgi:hypothetical protein
MNTALTLGWSINLLCLGFYMAAQGIGVLRWNLASHAVLALCVVVGVFVLVPQFGADGLIGAIVAGLVLSTVMVLAGNARFFGFFSLPLANVIFISGSVVFMSFIFSFKLNVRLFPIL